MHRRCIARKGEGYLGESTYTKRHRHKMHICMYIYIQMRKDYPCHEGQTRSRPSQLQPKWPSEPFKNAKWSI